MNETVAAAATQIPTDADVAFDELYRRDRDDVHAYVAGLLRDRSAAEDVTAAAFERAYRRRRSFNPKRGTRRAWLFGMVSPAKRKIARRVDLALSTSPDRFRGAADGVLDVVRDHGGFVVRSSVSGGDPDERSKLGHASFKLRIPAGQLPAALGDLSDLGHVVSRTDGTEDITSRFVSVKKRIAALEKTRQTLLRQLADAVTLIEQESIRRRLEIVEVQLSAAQNDLGDAQQRVNLVPVSVTIDADRALDGDDAGGWGLGDAVDDAGKVLSVTAGVLLVSAAVVARWRSWRR